MSKRASLLVAAIAASLGVVGLAIVADQNSGGVGSTASAPPIIQTGDVVFASGTVVLEKNGQASVCKPGGLLNGIGPKCLSVKVLLSGLTPAQTHDWSVSGDERYKTDVTVHGIWTGTSLEVREVTDGATPDPADARPISPCSDVPGRVPAEQSDAYDSALHRLDDLIEQHPAEYGGMWAASAKDGGSVLVAAVVVNNLSAEVAVHNAFPYPLCIVSVPNSTSRLRETFARLPSIDPPGDYTIDATSNRVRITVPVLDAVTWARFQVLGPTILITPLVRSESASLE
jgi:hypothetical protein